MQSHSLLTTPQLLFLSDIQLLAILHNSFYLFASYRCSPVTHVGNSFLLYLSIFILFLPFICLSLGHFHYSKKIEAKIWAFFPIFRKPCHV